MQKPANTILLLQVLPRLLLLTHQQYRLKLRDMAWNHTQDVLNDAL